jgi:hypothetical protein
MAHEHSHEDLKTYYVEQLCTIGIAGALGGIAVMLYQRGLLWFIATKVQPWVLAGGVALLVLVAVRAFVVWVQAGRKPVEDHGHEDEHEHEHHHHHDHDHEHHHDHVHGEECDHDHAHTHSHGGADDGHGHDHGAAPWRYVILLLPVVLYFLGLPNENMARADVRDSQEFKLTGEALTSLKKGGVPESVLDRLDAIKDKAFKSQEDLVSALHLVLDPAELQQYQPKILDSALLQGIGIKDLKAQAQDRPIGVSFTELQRAPASQDTRDYYEGKTVRVKGEYLPGNEHMFTLVRYKMNCCARDAVPLSAIILIDPKSETTLRKPKDYSTAMRGKWVQVVGQCQFQQRPDQANTWTTLIVLRPDAEHPLFDESGKDERALIKLTQPDASYYLQ